MNNKNIDSTALNRVMELDLDNALKLYGETVVGYIGKDPEFLLSDPIPEFRIELLNLYTQKHRDERKIVIKELTWQVDDSTNLTVWYEKTGDIFIPKHHKLWGKDAEF